MPAAPCCGAVKVLARITAIANSTKKAEISLPPRMEHGGAWRSMEHGAWSMSVACCPQPCRGYVCTWCCPTTASRGGQPSSSLVDSGLLLLQRPLWDVGPEERFSASYWRRPASRPDHQTPSRAKPSNPMPCVPQYFDPCLAQGQTDGRWAGLLARFPHPWHGALSRPFPRSRKQASAPEPSRMGEKKLSEMETDPVQRWLANHARDERQGLWFLVWQMERMPARPAAGSGGLAGWMDHGSLAQWPLAGLDGLASRSQGRFRTVPPRSRMQLCSLWPFGRPTSHPKPAWLGVVSGGVAQPKMDSNPTIWRRGPPLHLNTRQPIQPAHPTWIYDRFSPTKQGSIFEGEAMMGCPARPSRCFRRAFRGPSLPPSTKLGGRGPLVGSAWLHPSLPPDDFLLMLHRQSCPSPVIAKREGKKGGRASGADN